ncbi:MAG: hypothetical protein E7458_05645 [Ruminococcaceae bacterium]|nr:hypothetical protein [Oscillospiraceae bacterium]
MKARFGLHRKALLMVIVLALGLFGFHGCAAKPKKSVSSIESMTLTIHGMRGSRCYEITDEDGMIRLQRYQMYVKDGEDVLELDGAVDCDKESFLALINSCQVMSWDGFHGKHPKNVSDGDMFRFEASVNGGETIQADGSANFPEGYRDLVRSFNELLSGAELQ